MSSRDQHKKIMFAGLCAVCVAAVAGYAVLTARRVPVAEPPAPVIAKPPAQVDSAPVAQAPTPAAVDVAPVEVSEAPKPRAARQPRLFFRANLLGDNYGKLAVALVDAPDDRRFSPELGCERVYFSSGRGVCLVADRGVFTSYYAVSFNEELRAGWKIKLEGTPSRTRVSPSGRLASVTVFLSGHSYTATTFSTRTTILDAATGALIADLDEFAVTKDGAEFKSKDFNFWGVTFARNEDRFFATLWSAGKTYLIEGNLAARTAKVIHENVECPSLSPDNTRIAFKRRMEGGPRPWRIHVLDLHSMNETALAETRNVDDQVEWLDDRSVLYALSQSETGSSASTDIWVVAADGTGSPRKLLVGGFSPAVVR